MTHPGRAYVLPGVEVARAKVNLASGAAFRNDRYTTRSTPAATVASTAVVCSFTRSNASPADTKNSWARTPSSARRISSPSA